MSLLLQLMPLADAPAHIAWLDDDERARLAAFTDAARAAQFLAGHCLARELAARLAGGDAGQWRLVVCPDGRRQLEHAARPPLCASISHVQSSLAVAVGHAPIGVDLEASGRPRDWLRLARTMFSPGEVHALEATPDAAREPAFLATWTLKEAWAKRSGRGLQRGEARRCTALACAQADAEAWTWSLPDGGSLALAAAAGATVDASGVAGPARPWRYEPSPP